MKLSDAFDVGALIVDGWPNARLEKATMKEWWDAILHEDVFTMELVVEAVRRLLVSGVKTSTGPMLDEIVLAVSELWEERSRQPPKRALPVAPPDQEYRARWWRVHLRILESSMEDPVKRLFASLMGGCYERKEGQDFIPFRSNDPYTLLTRMEDAIREHPTPVCATGSGPMAQDLKGSV